MTYPRVLSEDETLDLALSGHSLARYGDGELSLALGGDCIFQKRNAVLASHLRKILIRPLPNLTVCIPNIEAPTKRAWRKYGDDQYRRLYTDGPYGSAFISRPDSAPWIDRADYWEKLAGLWRGKSVTLVAGTDVSLRAVQLDGATAIRRIVCPPENAWEQVIELDDAIGIPDGPVLLCAGPTATVLAHRLSKRGVHALDLGHVGLYMRHVGAYAIAPDDLCSPAYRAQLEGLHAGKQWGAHGSSHAETVVEWAEHCGHLRTVLDYGCGQGTLGKGIMALSGKAYKAAPPFKVQFYDPGVVHRDGLPKPADLVVATDVLEHIEPDKLSNVLTHLYRLAGKALFFTISCTPARELLPDGRNAHLIVEPPEWWLARLAEQPWKVERVLRKKGLWVWLTK